MPSISCCTRPQVFISFARLKKSSTSLNFFDITEFLDSGRKSRTLNSERWILDAGLWTMDSGRWILDSIQWTKDRGCRILNAGP